MKIFKKLASLAVFPLFLISFAHAQSVNYQPGFNLYSEAATLTDLFGTHGSQLDAPVALTHAFNYLKYFHAPAFPWLKALPDMDRDGVPNTYRDQIRFFFQACKTDRENGTTYADIAGCMREYMNQSGVGNWAYVVGPHATDAPSGSPLASVQHVLNLTDVRYYLSGSAAVIMGIGWYRLNPATQTYVRVGGHVFNVYGYEYNPNDGNTRMVLDIVNSWVDYSTRPREQMFDRVLMSALPNDGTRYPVETAFRMDGPAFQFPEKALVEDIMVAYPVAPAAGFYYPSFWR